MLTTSTHVFCRNSGGNPYVGVVSAAAVLTAGISEADWDEPRAEQRPTLGTRSTPCGHTALAESSSYGNSAIR